MKAPRPLFRPIYNKHSSDPKLKHAIEVSSSPNLRPNPAAPKYLF
jgi:hypothetical protein